MAKKTSDPLGDSVNIDGMAENQSVEAPSAPAQLTVAALAAKHGHTRKTVVDGDTPFDRSHLGADAAHGWSRHTALKSQDVTLSDDDYLAAVAAFDNGETHAPANKRGETTFTKEQAEAKLADDLKLGAAMKAKARANSQPAYKPNHAHAIAMKKSKTLAESSGVKKRGWQ
jgi:hypothetical protein